MGSWKAVGRYRFLWCHVRVNVRSSGVCITSGRPRRNATIVRVTEIASFVSGLGLVALVLFVLKAWEERKRSKNSARRANRT